MHFTPSWRTVLLGLAVVLAILAYPLVQTGRAASEPCAALDRTMDWSGCLRTIAVGDGPLLSVAAAPDGRHLAISRSTTPGPEHITTIELIALDGTPVWTVTEPGWFEHLVFSPDGSHLAGSDVLQATIVWDATSGAKLQQFEQTSSLLSFSADSSHLLVANELWRIADGALIDTIEPQDAAAKGVRLPAWGLIGVSDADLFSADGALRVHSPEDGSIQIVRTSDGRTVTLEQPPQDMRGMLRFSPDGTLILGQYFGWKDTVTHHLVVWRTEDGKQVAHRELTDQIGTTIWSADSTTLVIPRSYEGLIAFFPAVE